MEGTIYKRNNCKTTCAWQGKVTFDFEGRREERSEVLQIHKGRKNSLSHGQGVNGMFEDQTLLFLGRDGKINLS